MKVTLTHLRPISRHERSQPADDWAVICVDLEIYETFPTFQRASEFLWVLHRQIAEQLWRKRLADKFFIEVLPVEAGGKR